MNPRSPAPEAPLHELLAEASGLLLHPQPFSADQDGEEVVSRIEFFDPGVDQDLRDALVLATVTLSTRDEKERLASAVLAATAVVLPSHADAEEIASILAQQHSSNVRTPVLFQKTAWIGWAELHTILSRHFRALVDVRGVPRPDSLSGVAALLSEQSGASVTIEDRASRVLAYCTAEGEVDPLRRDTILQRAVPSWRVNELLASGFLQAVWKATDVVERPAENGRPARMVVAVRADGEAIGTIWAAYERTVAIDELRSLLRDAARVAAPLILRELGRPAHESRLREEALVSVLQGNGHVQPAATMLGLPMTGASCCLAVECEDEARRPVVEFHIAAAYPEVRATQNGATLFMLVQQLDDEREQDVAERLRGRLGHAFPAGTRVHIGVGSVVPGLAEVHRSAAEAEHALSAFKIRRRGDAAGGGIEVVTKADVQDSAVLIGVAALLAPHADELTAALRLLVDYDSSHDADLVPTLRAVLESFGTMASAARALRIHSNSLRYRIGRIREISGIDLSAPDSRLRTELGLLLMECERTE